jgi:hypothetical protein
MTLRSLLNEIGTRSAEFRDALLEFDWSGELAWTVYSVIVALYLCGWLFLTALRRANRGARRARGNRR